MLQGVTGSSLSPFVAIKPLNYLLQYMHLLLMMDHSIPDWPSPIWPAPPKHYRPSLLSWVECSCKTFVDERMIAQSTELCLQNWAMKQSPRPTGWCHREQNDKDPALAGSTGNRMMKAQTQYWLVTQAIEWQKCRTIMHWLVPLATE